MESVILFNTTSRRSPLCDVHSTKMYHNSIKSYMNVNIINHEYTHNNGFFFSDKRFNFNNS